MLCEDSGCIVVNLYLPLDLKPRTLKPKIKPADASEQGTYGQHRSASVWVALFGLNILVGLVFNQYMRRFNLVEHERRGFGLAGMALELMTAPVYVAAAAAQLAGRPLVYVVTAKGSATTGDTWRAFRPHLVWAAIAAGSIALGLALGHDYPSLYVWAAITVLVSLSPLAHIKASRIAARGAGRYAQAIAVASVPAERRIGDVLVAQGLLSLEQLGELLDAQAMADGPWQRLGELAVAHGYVTNEQVAAALSDGDFTPEPDLVGANS